VLSVLPVRVGHGDLVQIREHGRDERVGGLVLFIWIGAWHGGGGDGDRTPVVENEEDA